MLASSFVLEWGKYIVCQEEFIKMILFLLSINRKIIEFLSVWQVLREHYANMYGPTTGDVIRLADTDLYIRVESDATVYGDECKFGGGKVYRTEFHLSFITALNLYYHDRC